MSAEAGFGTRDGGDQSDQAAAIPFRRFGEDLQVCLIRRKGSRRWGIPKGFVDPGDTPEQTALNETWEEAGLRGRLAGDPIGCYTYAKWSNTYTVAVYLLEVLEQEDRWEEENFRERRWVTFDEAASLLARSPVRPLLDRAIRALEQGR